jgi:hypothetical protein
MVETRKQKNIENNLERIFLIANRTPFEIKETKGEYEVFIGGSKDKAKKYGINKELYLELTKRIGIRQSEEEYQEKDIGLNIQGREYHVHARYFLNSGSLEIVTAIDQGVSVE